MFVLILSGSNFRAMESSSKRQKAFQELKFGNDDLPIMHLNVKRQKIIDYIVCNIKLRPKNKPKFKIQKYFDCLLLKMIRDKIEFLCFLETVRSEILSCNEIQT